MVMIEDLSQNKQNQELSETKSHTGHTWYIRKKNKITGPFPAGQLSQLLVVGRLSLDDEISHDKDEWVLISDVPSLIPEVLSDDADPGQSERLAAARRWADERREERRETNVKKPRRQSKGRRTNELLEEVEYRNKRESIYRSFRERPKRAFFILFIFISLVSALIAGTFNYSPLVLIDEPDCNALPRAGVNWRNCNKSQLLAIRADLSEANLHSTILRGANLFASNFTQSRMDYSNLSGGNFSYAVFIKANLKGANFKNTDLRNANFSFANVSYADFFNATIVDVNFTNADLSNAIWINGEICQQGSIGICKFK